MKKKIILPLLVLPFLLLSLFLFAVKFIKTFRVILYLIITGSLRETYFLRGAVTLIKVNDKTVLRLPTEYDFIILSVLLSILIAFIILFTNTIKKNKNK